MAAVPNNLPIIKCVAVGDGMVGKTSLLIVHKTGNFPEKYRPTVFDNYVTEETFDDQSYCLSLWDTAGQEDYEQLRPLSYPNTHVFLLCFSLPDHASFANITSKWQPELQHYSPYTPIVLVGTKADLVPKTDKASPAHNSGSPRDRGKQLAKTIAAVSYMECSARTKEGVAAVFQEAIRVALKHQRKRPKKKKCIFL